MASPAQIAANRLNAAKSTGPRTDAGKSASRLNALRHGADSELPVIPGEDPDILEALALDYRAQYRPATAEERFLVDTLIESEWLRRRFRRLEAEMTNHLLSEMETCDNPLGVLYCSETPGARALERVRRHYEAANRAWFRACRDIERLRRHAADDLFLGLPPLPELELEPEPDPDPDADAPLDPAPSLPNWVRSTESATAPDIAAIAARSSARDPRLALRL